jgi:hypothetical protein
VLRGCRDRSQAAFSGGIPTLGGAAAAVVGGEEEDHLRELVGQDPPLERLIVERAPPRVTTTWRVDAGRVAGSRWRRC